MRSGVAPAGRTMSATRRHDWTTIAARALTLALLIVIVGIGWYLLRGSKARLIAAARGADRLVVRTPNMATMAFEPTFEVVGGVKVSAFLDQIDLGGGDGWACACLGDAQFDLYDGQELLVTLGYHHGERLRWHSGGWRGDVPLTKQSQARLVDWLKANGVRGFERIGPDATHEWRPLAKVFGDGTLDIISHASKVEVYRLGRLPPEIDPRDTKLEDFPVLAAPVLVEGQTADNLRRVLCSFTTYGPDLRNDCDAGYTIGVRVTSIGSKVRVVDLAFCFRCDVMATYHNGQRVGIGSFQPAHGPLVRLIKRILADDAEIQSLD